MVLLASVVHFHHDGGKGRSLLFFTVDSAPANLANHFEDNTPQFHDSQGFQQKKHPFDGAGFQLKKAISTKKISQICRESNFEMRGRKIPFFSNKPTKATTFRIDFTHQTH